jgi:hypothetical protein
MKQCPKCQETKPFESFYFYTKNDTHKGYHRRCKKCEHQARQEHRKTNPKLHSANSRRYKLKKQYNLTPEGYDDILKRQKGVCAICDRISIDGRRLHVDHCHQTGKVRGLLCHDCNRGIGMFKDDSTKLQKAADYLSLKY